MILPKRLLRFSLRTLLIVVTVLGIWLGLKVSAARRQKEAVEAVLNAGATVVYDYQMKPRRPFPPAVSSLVGMQVGVKLPDFQQDATAQISGPAWLRERLGDDYFRTVVAVYFNRPKDSITKSDVDALAKLPEVQSFVFDGREHRSVFGDADFSVLSRLHSLRMLSIMNCSEVNGSLLAELANPGNLQWLCLNTCNIDDRGMERIAMLTNLEKLMLSSTPITDESLIHVQNLTKLEDLQLSSTKITDAGLKYLRRLNKLTYLSLQSTRVTSAGIADLQKELRATNIVGP
jgi:hypothetical protein